MRVPSATEMLTTWERGFARGPVERGLLLLGLASPQETSDVLAALSIGERNRRLLRLRAAIFGRRLSGVTTCGACGERLDLDVGLEQLLAGAASGEPFEFRSGAHRVLVRFPDSNDLLLASGCGDAESAQATLLERCIVATSSSEAPSTGPLPESVLVEAAHLLSAADPQADMRLALECPSCATEVVAPFDINSFLWAEIDTWAGRVLEDVHLLASAYGWTESEILCLSDYRRHRYLQMVGV